MALDQRELPGRRDQPALDHLRQLRRRRRHRRVAGDRRDRLHERPVHAAPEGDLHRGGAALPGGVARLRGPQGLRAQRRLRLLHRRHHLLEGHGARAGRRRRREVPGPRRRPRLQPRRRLQEDQVLHQRERRLGRARPARAPDAHDRLLADRPAGGDAGAAVVEGRQARRRRRPRLCHEEHRRAAADVRRPRPRAWPSARATRRRATPGPPAAGTALPDQLGDEPRIYLYDAFPGGIGFSAPLYGMHHDLLDRTRELIAGCDCDHGCPTCVGPIGETGPRAKAVALALLAALGAGADCPRAARRSADAVCGASASARLREPAGDSATTCRSDDDAQAVARRTSARRRRRSRAGRAARAAGRVRAARRAARRRRARRARRGGAGRRGARSRRRPLHRRRSPLRRRRSARPPRGGQHRPHAAGVDRGLCHAGPGLARHARRRAAAGPLLQDLDGLCVVDLETTGLAGGAGTQAFLVGCARIDGDGIADPPVPVARLRARAGPAAPGRGVDARSHAAPHLQRPHLRRAAARDALQLPPAGRGRGATLPHLDALHPARRFWRDRSEVGRARPRRGELHAGGARTAAERPAPRRRRGRVRDPVALLPVRPRRPARAAGGGARTQPARPAVHAAGLRARRFAGGAGAGRGRERLRVPGPGPPARSAGAARRGRGLLRAGGRAPAGRWATDGCAAKRCAGWRLLDGAPAAPRPRPRPGAICWARAALAAGPARGPRGTGHLPRAPRARLRCGPQAGARCAGRDRSTDGGAARPSTAWRGSSASCTAFETGRL